MSAAGAIDSGTVLELAYCQRERFVCEVGPIERQGSWLATDEAGRLARGCGFVEWMSRRSDGLVARIVCASPADRWLVERRAWSLGLSISEPIQ